MSNREALAPVGAAAIFVAVVHLTSCVPKDLDPHVLPQANRPPGSPPPKVAADKLQKMPPPQVANLYAGGVRFPFVTKEADHFYFTVEFTQPINPQSLRTPDTAAVIATCPGKTPPGARALPLSGAFSVAGPGQKTMLFTSTQYVNDLILAAGWQTAQEIAAARKSFSVQVLLLGSPRHPGGPVATGSTGIPLDGDKNGQPGGNFTTVLSYAGMFP